MQLPALKTLIKNKHKLLISISYKETATKWQIPTATTADRVKINIQLYPTADIPQLIRCVAGIPY